MHPAPYPGQLLMSLLLQTHSVHSFIMFFQPSQSQKFSASNTLAGAMGLVLVPCSALGLWCQLRDNVTGSANIPCLLEKGEHSFLPTTKPCSLPWCQLLGKAFGKRADASKIGVLLPKQPRAIPQLQEANSLSDRSCF